MRPEPSQTRRRALWIAFAMGLALILGFSVSAVASPGKPRQSEARALSSNKPSKYSASSSTTVTSSVPTTTSTTNGPTCPTIPGEPDNDQCTINPITCGSNFLSSSDENGIDSDYDLVGMPDCYYDHASDSFFLLLPGDNGVNSSQGGNAIAVDKCSSSDATCQNPNSTHPIMDFEIYPAPDPIASNFHAGGLENQSDSTIDFIDGACKFTIFDIATGSWYQGTYDVGQALQNNTPPQEAPLTTLPPYEGTSGPVPPADRATSSGISSSAWCSSS
jgi:hypothetical protein